MILHSNGTGPANSTQSPLGASAETGEGGLSYGTNSSAVYGTGVNRLDSQYTSHARSCPIYRVAQLK